MLSIESQTNPVLISFVVPIYKRISDIPRLFQAIHDSADVILSLSPSGVRIELILVDDGSFIEIPKFAIKSNALRGRVEVRLIQLSRNFGLHSALICGYREAKGDVVIRMNSDNWEHVQHVPALCIPILSGEIDRVVLVHELNDPKLSRVFRMLEKLLIQSQREKNESPVRAFSRRFIDHLNEAASTVNYTLELEDWVGLSTSHIYAPESINRRSESTFSYSKKFNLALEILSLKTVRSFQFVALGATGLFLLNFIFAILLVGFATFGNIGGNGFVTLALLQVGLSSVQLLLTSLIGLVGSTSMKESQRRAPYVVESYKLVEITERLENS